MAYTVSSIVDTVMGDKRLWTGYVSPDAITGTVTIPGAIAVDAILAFCPYQLTASITCVTLYPNSSALGTAAMGSIGMSNVVSSTGAKYILTVLYH